MAKVGIKVGPQDGIEVLKRSQAKYCEVWFRIDWVDKYQALFEYMQTNNIQFGLHFWGMVQGKYFPNLLYNRDGVAQETYELIRQTIEVAEKYGAFYVNYHPESLRLMGLNLDTGTVQAIEGAEIDEETGFQALVDYSRKLKALADPKGVDLYIETVPRWVPSMIHDLSGRLTPLENLGLRTAKIIELGQLGFHLCYDIGHVTGQYPYQSREVIFAEILQEARDMVAYTKLVHVNTTIEPLNGTDSHHGILAQDFNQNVFPNREQVLELLTVFRQNHDILFVPEPQLEKMVENYQELKQWLESKGTSQNKLYK